MRRVPERACQRLSSLADSSETLTVGFPCSQTQMLFSGTLDDHRSHWHREPWVSAQVAEDCSTKSCTRRSWMVADRRRPIRFVGIRSDVHQVHCRRVHLCGWLDRTICVFDGAVPSRRLASMETRVGPADRDPTINSQAAGGLQSDQAARNSAAARNHLAREELQG